MNEELNQVIEREKWVAANKGMCLPSNCVGSKEMWMSRKLHNDSLERIAEAAKKPRIMKLWTDDCKPEKSGWYWWCYYANKTPIPAYYETTRDGYGQWFDSNCNEWTPKSYKRPIYFLELEPIPILPEDKE